MTPSDWTLFRARIATWRDRYLDRKTRDLARILTDGDGSPTDRFWTAHAAIRDEARTLRRCLDGSGRGSMDLQLVQMLHAGVIEDADLDDFSDDLRSWIRAWVQPLDDDPNP